MSIGALVAVPELQAEGPARLVARKGNTMVIRFLASGAEMTQEERNVTRYCLLPGTRVKVDWDGAQREVRIQPARIQRDAASGLLVYAVAADGDGAPRNLREDGILLVPQPRSPAEQLVTAAFHDLRPQHGAAGSALGTEPWGPQTFCAREELLAWRDAAWNLTGGVVGLAGARVIPLPHQLLTARRVLTDRQVRFLLADEVGLGKTIEAGLIVQSLLAMQPQLRVLIVVPGALVSQWFLELFVKFGGRTFLMLDNERLATYPGNPWKDEQFVLASSRAVEELDAKGGLRFAQSRWDVLVVDECHRMQPGGVLYKRIAVLSKNTPNVLLLSATPARQHPDAYLALLALLQPQVYRSEDQQAFQARLAAHDRVVDLLGRTREAVDGFAAIAAAWRALLAGDTLLAGLAQALAGGGTDGAVLAARDALVAYVRDHYQLDHRIIRHRRQVLARLSQASGVKGLQLSQRILEHVPYQPDKAERTARAQLASYRQALVAAFAKPDAGGPGVPPRLAHWLLQLELAASAHPRVLDRLLAMRATVLADPGGFASYRARAVKGETTAQVLRNDLSENEISTHIATSASCHCDPKVEGAVLAALQAAVAAWAKAAAPKGTARTRALVARLEAFWNERPQEKVLVFTGHAIAVGSLREVLGAAFGEDSVETFGAHQDTVAREEAARRFRDDRRCPLLICDPLGGEGRNFQFVSVVAHHDLPWSVAAVEQRIGRVDRIGRDGDIPSWILAAEDQPPCIDAVWGEVLERAVGVFTSSSSGLEFVCDALETRALDAVFAGGAAGLVAAMPELTALVARERDARDLREDECFHEDADVYREAAALSEAVAAAPVPVDAVCRWIRGMGGQAKRNEEAPRAFRLRTRAHDHPQAGVFDRGTALAHPQLAFFAMGHGVIDRLLADATAAGWCRATAWRRKPDAGLARWEGVRVAYELAFDLAPLIAAGLPLEALRRLLAVAPPVRTAEFIRLPEAAVEADAGALAALVPPFDARSGDVALSVGASRELWTRLLLGGKQDQVIEWQAGAARACALADARCAELLPAQRDGALAALQRSLGESLAVANAQAASARQRFGSGPEVERVDQEADQERRQAEALAACLRGARLEVASLAYVIVA